MGAIVRVYCAICQKSQEFKIGCGLMHADLNKAAESFPMDTAAQIKSRAGQMEMPVFHFQYRLSYCPQCGRIESTPVLKFMNDSTVYTGVCAGCGRQTELAGTDGEPEDPAEGLDQAMCPECRARSLKIEEIGWWD